MSKDAQDRARLVVRIETVRKVAEALATAERVIAMARGSK